MDKIKKFVLDTNNRYIVIGIPITILVVLIIIFIIFNVNGSNVSNGDIEKIIENEKDLVLYIYNSDSNNEYNSKILSLLDKNNINYNGYNISKVQEDEYIELLNILNIDSKYFDYPAIIYVKEGNVYADISNIDDASIVEKFIEDYDLKELK